jgi:DNA repair protein RadC
MPLLINLTDEEKEIPLDNAEMISQIMHAILNRELKVSVLPPLANKTKSKLKDIIKPTKKVSSFKSHAILTDGSNLLNAGVEYFWALGLRADMRLAFLDLVAIGDSMSAKVGIKEAMRGFMFYEVAYMVIVHNHPSGDLEFSKDDILITKGFIKYCNIIKTPLQDHLIITAGGGYNSLVMADEFDNLYKQVVAEEIESRTKAKLIVDQANQLVAKDNRIAELEAKLKQAGLL